MVVCQIVLILFSAEILKNVWISFGIFQFKQNGNTASDDAKPVAGMTVATAEGAWHTKRRLIIVYIHTYITRNELRRFTAGCEHRVKRSGADRELSKRARSRKQGSQTEPCASRAAADISRAPSPSIFISRRAAADHWSHFSVHFLLHTFLMFLHALIIL